MKNSVFKTFTLTISKICLENHDSGRLLFVLGLLDGTFIDERITKRIFELKEFDYVTSRSVLLDYSVIKCHERTFEPSPTFRLNTSLCILFTRGQ